MKKLQTIREEMAIRMIKSSEFGKNARQARQNKPAGRIYVPSGWKHYARGRKTVFPRKTNVLLRVFFCLRHNNSEARKNGCFFRPKREKTVFPRETNVLLRVFFCLRHNVFQPEGVSSSDLP